MKSYKIRRAFLNKKQKKTAMVVFEIFLFLLAFLFLMPVFLAFINSFKSNSEIQMNVASFPKFSVKIPKKMQQKYFEGSIINRLAEEKDKNFFLSFYHFHPAKYRLKYKKKSSKILSLERDLKLDLPELLPWKEFNENIIQKVDNDFLKSKVRECYFYVDGVYTLQTEPISKEDQKEMLDILRKTGSFRTAKENFIKNYAESWKQTKFPVVFMNTLIITVLSVLGIILISSMAAYAMVRTKTAFSWFFFLLFVFAMVVPFQAIMFPLVRTAKALGLLGSIHGIILIYMAVGCPLAIFMYHGFIKGVPLELEESAALDGAGKFRIFFTIVLPLLTPITSTIAILDVLWIWNDFLLPLIILMKKVVTVQLAQYYTRGAYSRDFGMELASLMLATFPVILFYLFMQKYVIKGITAGAVKG